jgi:hypothetical protein
MVGKLFLIYVRIISNVQFFLAAKGVINTESSKWKEEFFV